MRLSDDRINHPSHVLFRALNAMDEVDFIEEENDVRLRIKKTLVECLREFDKLEEKIQASLGTYSRKIVEGSREWDVMCAAQDHAPVLIIWSCSPCITAPNFRQQVI